MKKIGKRIVSVVVVLILVVAMASVAYADYVIDQGQSNGTGPIYGESFSLASPYYITISYMGYTDVTVKLIGLDNYSNYVTEEIPFSGDGIGRTKSIRTTKIPAGVYSYIITPTNASAQFAYYVTATNIYYNQTFG